MDVDNEYSDAGSQRQPSAEHTPQGATAQVGGASSQGNPTPTSVHSSNTPSTASGPATANVTHTQNSKRRRGLGVVTPNACTECRKKRAKVCSRSAFFPGVPGCVVRSCSSLSLYVIACPTTTFYLACDGLPQLAAVLTSFPY